MNRRAFDRGRSACGPLRAFAFLHFLLVALMAPALAAPTPAVTSTVELRDMQTEHGPVRLPDDWSRTRPGFQGVAVYHTVFDAPSAPPGELQAVYLVRVCSNYELRINGRLLERGGSLREPVTRNCYHSQLVTLPEGTLRRGSNEFELRLAGYPLERVAARQRAGGLSEILIGPEDRMRALRDSQVFWNVTVAQIIAATLIVLGVVLLVLAYVRRMSYLAYFAAAAIGWAGLSARLWWRDIALPNDLVELMIWLGFVPVAVCAVLFLVRYAGVRSRKLDAMLWSQCLLAPLTYAMAGPNHLFTLAAVWYTALAAEVFAGIAIYLWQAWRAQRQEFWPMAFIMGAVALVLAAEVGIQDRVIALPNVHVIHFALPIIFCAVAFRLIQTFAHALRTAEEARIHLEARVREISAEIERNFANLAEARVEQIAEKERKRIAADLHDDLGAKLLTIVHTSDNDRISTLAREALEEMRLSVRGLTGKPVRLADALADWRAETVSRLGDAGIEVDWAGNEELAPRTLAARAYVQTTRILREAVSNMIKHSGASRCSVRCSTDEDFQLVIRDNGRGIPLELDGQLDRGHGMSSMKQRAKQLHGQCLVESGPGYGTVIRLTLPL
jgi:signal transduction histidine kinase